MPIEPRQIGNDRLDRSDFLSEKWIRHEGLLVAGIVIGLVLLALLEQVMLRYFRH